MNKTMLTGHLTKDPVVREVVSPKTGEKTRVCNFTIGVNISGGESQFWYCTLWDSKTTKIWNIVPWLQKGRCVAVVGEGRHDGTYYEKTQQYYVNNRLRIDSIELTDKKPDVEPPAAASEAAPQPAKPELPF